jgi:hypothetical protein
MIPLKEKILDMRMLRGVTEEDIEAIAGESDEDAKKRREIEQDLKTMQEVLREMEEYRSANLQNAS